MLVSASLVLLQETCILLEAVLLLVRLVIASLWLLVTWVRVGLVRTIDGRRCRLSGRGVSSCGERVHVEASQLAQ